MTTQLVETSEEDSFLAVARHVGDLLNEGEERTALAETPGSRFTADCVTLLAEQRFGALLERLISQADVLFSKSAQKDLECCVNIICHLVPRVPPADVTAAASSVASALTAQTDSHPQQRLAGLTELFNVTEQPEAQLHVLLELLKYGRQAGLAHLLVPVVKANAEGWIKDLAKSPVQQREVLLTAADTLRSSKKKVKAATRDAFRLTLKSLETLEGASASEVAALRDPAGGAVAEFIRSPDMFQFDLLDSPAIQQLKDDQQYGPIYQLLLTLLAGDIQGFETLATTHEHVFSETVGVSREEVLTKMRLMALLGLGTKSAEVSFQAIQETLGVGQEEVESWVVRAIGKRLLEAKIDQLGGTVTITRCSHRSFGAEQWRELAAQLAAWKDNVAVVRKLVASQNGSLTPPRAIQPAAVRA